MMNIEKKAQSLVSGLTQQGPEARIKYLRARLNESSGHAHRMVIFRAMEIVRQGK